MDHSVDATERIYGRLEASDLGGFLPHHVGEMLDLSKVLSLLLTAGEIIAVDLLVVKILDNPLGRGREQQAVEELFRAVRFGGATHLVDALTAILFWNSGMTKI